MKNITEVSAINILCEKLQTCGKMQDIFTFSKTGKEAIDNQLS